MNADPPPLPAPVAVFAIVVDRELPTVDDGDTMARTA